MTNVHWACILLPIDGRQFSFLTKLLPGGPMEKSKTHRIKPTAAAALICAGRACGILEMRGLQPSLTLTDLDASPQFVHFVVPAPPGMLDQQLMAAVEHDLAVTLGAQNVVHGSNLMTVSELLDHRVVVVAVNVDNAVLSLAPALRPKAFATSWERVSSTFEKRNGKTVQQFYAEVLEGMKREVVRASIPALQAVIA